MAACGCDFRSVFLRAVKIESWLHLVTEQNTL